MGDRVAVGAMAAWKRTGGVHKFEKRLIDGMVDNGYELPFAQAIFQQMLGFGEYGFPESHAYSFALLAYASDYLLLDMAFRAHPQRVSYTTHTGLTLDHTVWLHRPVRFDQWHLYTQQAVAVGEVTSVVAAASVMAPVAVLRM